MSETEYGFVMFVIGGSLGFIMGMLVFWLIPRTKPASSK